MSTCDVNLQSSIKVTLESIAIQFFEMVPIRRIQWQGENVTSKDLDIETQKYMISRTVGSDLCRKYPPSYPYQRAFLKKLLSTLETFNVEICDELYEAYTDLLQQRDRDDDSLCYKTYTLDTTSRVTIQESVNMISFGTTGLSTWQAAQHLAELGLQNKHLLEKRHILELGCGLGLTGLALCKTCKVNTYTFTDCNTQVLNLLAKNIELNFCESWDTYKEDSEIPEHSNSEQNCISNHGNGSRIGECETTDNVDDKLECVINRHCDDKVMSENDINTPEPVLELNSKTSYSEPSCSYSGHENNHGYDSKSCWSGDFIDGLSICKTCRHIRLGILDWENPDKSMMENLASTDVILAADVVYDTTIIPALVSVLKMLLSRSTKVIAYIASTIRNEDTRDAFLISLSSESLKYEQMEPPTTQLFHYDRSVPIEILKITAVV